MIRKLLATALAATLMATTALHAQSLADVAKKTDENAAKAAISAVEEEARRLGVLPGWLR